MLKAAAVLIGLIAALHFYIAWFEIFAWVERGPGMFEEVLAKELYKPTKPLAANQGLYNAFLAAGLVWSFMVSDRKWRTNIALFFLACVATAGVFGAMTLVTKILFYQTVPAVIAIFLLLFARKGKEN